MNNSLSHSQRHSFLLHIGSLVIVATLWLVLRKLPEVDAAAQRGVPVLLMRNCTPKEETERGDGREVWIRLKANDRASVNEDPIDSKALIPAMTRIFETRQEKALYLLGDDDIEYQRVAETAANLEHAIPDLYILLPTSSNMSSANFPCLTLADPLGWGAMLQIRYGITLPIN